MVILMLLGLTWTVWRYIGLIFCLVIVAWVDSRSMIIPDEAQLIIVLLAFLRLPVEGWLGVIDGLIGALAVLLPVFLLVGLMNKVFKRETMGGGDLKLLTGLGLHFGAVGVWQVLTIACWLALPIALYQRNKQREIPFAPFLTVSAIAEILNIFG